MDRTEPILSQQKNDENNVLRASVLPHKRLGAKVFVGTFGTSVFVLGCAVIQGIILARILGPSGRGDYTSIILWPTVFAYLGLLGTSFVIGRLAAKEKDIGSIFRSGILLAVLTSVLAVLIGYWLLPFLVPAEKHRLLPFARWFLLYIPVCQISANLAAVDQGSGNFFRLNFIRALQSPVFITVLVVIFILGIEKVIWFVMALLVAHAIVVLSRMILMLREHGIKGRIYPVLKILRRGFPFALTTAGVQGYQYVDKILLLWLLEPRHMGLYVIALSASSVMNTISGSMGLVSFTIAAQQSNSEGFGRVGSIFRKAVVAKLVIGTCLALAMPFLLPLVYGEEFSEAVKPAILLIAGSSFAGLSLLLDQCMRGQGRPLAGLAARVVAIVTMVVLGLPLSRYWGIIGMAGAFLVAQFCCLCVIVWKVLIHYDNAKLSGFVPKLGDITDLLGVARTALGRLGLIKQNDSGQL